MLIRVQSLTAKLLFGVKVISKTELSIVLRPNNGMSPENLMSPENAQIVTFRV